MKKTAKVLLALVLVLISLMSTTAFATETFEAIEPSFEVLVNGERFYSLHPIVVIDGRTYLPLRALGDCLGVYVDWNGELSQAEVSSTIKVGPTVYTDYPYEKFTDVPDFGKISGVNPYAEEKKSSVLGQAVVYGYQVPAENFQKAIDDYINELVVCGFEVFLEQMTGANSTTMYLRSSTGRMIYFYTEGNGVAVTILEKPRSEEDWKVLSSAKDFPQKKFSAVPATFKVMVDGVEFISENPAMVINDRTYLPLRAMGDCLGVFVDWDEETQTVIVNSNQ